MAPTLQLLRLLDLNCAYCGRWLLIFSAFLLLLTHVATCEEFNADTECITATTMPLLSRDELKNAVPCDAMGGVYLVGLGFPILPPPKLADLGEEYSYYYNARLYLSSLVHPGVVPPEDNYGLLLAMLPNLKDADNGRAEIYTAFIIWQYIEVNENKLLFTRGILFESVKSSYSAGSNLDLLDLACIVKADIPTVEISQVKRSPIYAECIRKGLDNWFN